MTVTDPRIELMIRAGLTLPIGHNIHVVHMRDVFPYDNASHFAEAVGLYGHFSELTPACGCEFTMVNVEAEQ